MPGTDNKALVRRFFDDVLNGNDPATASDLLADDFVAHHPAFPDGIRGAAGMTAIMQAFRGGFSDLRYRIEALVAEQDLVAARWVAEGTHDGVFQGIPPTHERIVVTGMDLFRVADGRCAEAWVNSDFLGLLQQIGAVPAPQQGAR